MLSSAVSLFLLMARMIATHEPTYWFMSWNLILAWVPLGLAWWLLARLRSTAWFSPANIVLVFLWLGFLPNAFYIASDIIHLPEGGGVSYLFDVVMMLSFTFNGFVLGFLSVYGIHNRLKQKLGGRWTAVLIGLVFLACSFAIYLGRYLRWNSWDVFVHPVGVIFDVSDPFINPSSHPQVFTTMAMFFILLSSIYAVSYQLVKVAKAGLAELDS